MVERRVLNSQIPGTETCLFHTLGEGISAVNQRF